MHSCTLGLLGSKASKRRCSRLLTAGTAGGPPFAMDRQAQRCCVTRGLGDAVSRSRRPRRRSYVSGVLCVPLSSSVVASVLVLSHFYVATF